MSGYKDDESPPHSPGSRTWGGRISMRMPFPLEVAKRQSGIVQLAMAILGSEEAMIFLNSHNAMLRGRPLDLALVDAAGYALVENALHSKANVPRDHIST